jgi:hypothetical protein
MSGNPSLPWCACKPSVLLQRPLSPGNHSAKDGMPAMHAGPYTASRAPLNAPCTERSRHVDQFPPGFSLRVSDSTFGRCGASGSVSAHVVHQAPAGITFPQPAHARENLITTIRSHFAAGWLVVLWASPNDSSQAHSYHHCRSGRSSSLRVAHPCPRGS